MGLQDVIRFFLPREAHFYDFLERQAKAAHDGAKALNKFATNGQSTKDARDAVQKIEHEGDRIVHEMEEALAQTFVTPIDREDLQKLSSELDTVLDLTNAAARACDMLGVKKPTEPMKKLIAILLKATAKIDETIPRLRKHQYGDVVIAARELRKIEKEGDAIYREAVSKLFQDEGVDAKALIREKTVLEDLENALDQCDAIANSLANLSVKHG
jgi:predicted phosphate transport protein (TIGR00153 family)